jgi:transposase
VRAQLSSRARAALEAIARSSEEGREVRRAQGLLWLDAGEDVSEVAKRLGVSRQMLYGLVERYEQRRKLPVGERIKDSEHSGRPAHKRELVMTELKILLLQAPSEYGYRAQRWTVGMLRKQIEQKHQLAVSDDTVQRALADLRYSCKRPRYVLARRDAQWRQAKGGFNKA